MTVSVKLYKNFQTPVVLKGRILIYNFLKLNGPRVTSNRPFIEAPAERIQKTGLTSHVVAEDNHYVSTIVRWKVDLDAPFVRHEVVTGEFVKLHRTVLSLNGQPIASRLYRQSNVPWHSGSVTDLR